MQWCIPAHHANGGVQHIDYYTFIVLVCSALYPAVNHVIVCATTIRYSVYLNLSRQAHSGIDQQSQNTNHVHTITRCYTGTTSTGTQLCVLYTHIFLVN